MSGVSFTAIDTTFTQADRLPFRVIISVSLEVYRTAASVISPEDANVRVVNLYTRGYTKHMKYLQTETKAKFSRKSEN